MNIQFLFLEEHLEDIEGSVSEAKDVYYKALRQKLTFMKRGVGPKEVFLEDSLNLKSYWGCQYAEIIEET